jgi:hypothetical protein
MGLTAMAVLAEFRKLPGKEREQKQVCYHLNTNDENA